MTLQNAARGWGCILRAKYNFSGGKLVKNKKTIKIAETCGIVAIFTLAALGVIMLLQPKETRSTTTSTQAELKVLDCKSSSPTNPFFASDVATSPLHEVKLQYKNDNLDRVNYTYTAKFESQKIAENVLSLLHANYNIFMGKTSIYQEDLTPTFSNIDTEDIINLYIELQNLTVDTAKFIFLENEEYLKLNKLSIDEVKKIYEKKSFICEIK